MSPSPSPIAVSTQALERFSLPGAWVFSCEHASARVPAPLRTTADDRAWLQTHWGFDIGARTVVRSLVRQLGGTAVLSRFSRLVCDANRPPDHLDLVRSEVGGHALSFNRKLSSAEVQRRLGTCHQPYHQALDQALTQVIGDNGRALLLSVHSFTPVWSKRLRTMDVGVLFNEHEDRAILLQRSLQRHGLDVALNLPYSGREGLIYAAQRHGQGHGVMYLELELNQALIATPAKARRVAKVLGPALLGLDDRRQSPR